MAVQEFQTHSSRVVAFSLALAALTAAVGSRGAGLSAARVDSLQSGSRPNIVVLMTDDLDVVSFQAAVRAGFLPHLTRLFARGTRFRESFVSESLCCPSRATYLTGLYPQNHGVVRNGGPRGGFEGFVSGFADNNLATWMQAAGYRTAYLGKYLNGYADATFVPPGWDEWQVLVEPSIYCMYGYRLSNNGHPVLYHYRLVKDYQTDVLASLAEDFIRSSAEGGAQPLFLNIAPTAPHEERGCYNGIRSAPRHHDTPLLPLPHPASFNEEDMSDKPGWMRDLPVVNERAMARLYNQRIDSLRAVDDLLGRVVSALDAVGELERTAFVFTSDNGYLLGRHRWKAKVLLYEESIRVPLLVRVPNLDVPWAVDEIALNSDLAPTIADLAGAASGLVADGRSLLPLLDRTAARWRKRFLVAFPPLPRGPEPDRPRNVPPFFAVRSGADGELSDLVYAETMSEHGASVVDRELYDLDPRVDLFQLESRHRDPLYFFKQQRLRQHLETLKTCGHGTCQILER